MRVVAPGYWFSRVARSMSSSKNARRRLALSSAMPEEPCSQSSATRRSRSSGSHSISMEYIKFQDIDFRRERMREKRSGRRLQEGPLRRGRQPLGELNFEFDDLNGRTAGE